MSLPAVELRRDSSIEDSVTRSITLTDGRRVRLRSIRPTDAPLLREGFKRLSPESRFMRFFRAMEELPDSAVRYLTEVDGQNHVAMVATSTPEEWARGYGRGFGVGRFVRSDKDPTSAELAITVSDEVQGRGLGRKLASVLAMAARERGIDTFEMSVLSSNARARRLLHRLGAEPYARDWDVVHYRIATSALVNAS